MKSVRSETRIFVSNPLIVIHKTKRSLAWKERHDQLRSLVSTVCTSQSAEFTNGEFLKTDVTGDNERQWSSLSVVSHSLRNANRLPGLYAIVEWKETVTGAGFEPAPPSETATWTQRLRPLGHPAWLITIECRKHCQQAKEIVCNIKILYQDLCCEFGSIARIWLDEANPCSILVCNR